MIPDIDRIQSGNAQTRRHGCVWNFKEGTEYTDRRELLNVRLF